MVVIAKAQKSVATLVRPEKAKADMYFQVQTNDIGVHVCKRKAKQRVKKS